MRCTWVGAGFPLAVVKLGPRFDRASAADITGHVRAIRGVSQVRLDQLRSTIHVLYDGKSGTVENLIRLLGTCHPFRRQFEAKRERTFHTRGRAA